MTTHNAEVPVPKEPVTSSATEAELRESKDLPEPNQHDLPPGIEAITAGGTRESPCGTLIRRSDLPAIRAAAVEDLRGRLPDPDKLRLLADWFDEEQPSRGWTGTEVQDDLRKWADAIATLDSDREGDPHA